MNNSMTLTYFSDLVSDTDLINHRVATESHNELLWGRHGEILVAAPLGTIPSVSMDDVLTRH